MIKIKTIPVGPLETNCYVVIDSNSNDAIIIDPGAEAGKILSEVENAGANLRGVILTHGHGDHIGAVSYIISNKNVPLWIHSDDAPMLTDAEKNLSAMLGFSITSHHPYNNLTDGEILQIGSLKFKVLHTPGHTRGGVSFFFDDNKNPVVFTGDTLFCGDVGRCDLPGSSWEALQESILNKLYTLPENTSVFPGHGPPSSIANEKINNNYVKAL